MTLLRSLSLVAFAGVLGGCGKSSPDTATPAPAGEVGAPTTSRRPLTITGISLDPNLASGCGITGAEAFFEFDSAQVDAADTGVLAQLATCLASGPMQGRRIEVVGHADPRGSDEYNAKLGRSRAHSVQEFLVGRGMQSGAIVVSSAGELGADPNDPAEWPYDRRVDIRLAP